MMEILNGEKSTINLPKSDVIQVILEDGTHITARPSGTEPKIKFYIEIKDVMKNTSEYDALEAKASKKVAAIKQSLSL